MQFVMATLVRRISRFQIAPHILKSHFGSVCFIYSLFFLRKLRILD